MVSPSKSRISKVQTACLQSWYVSGQIAGQNINFLLDTGAECSIISYDAWLSLKRAVPGLALDSSERGLELADGKRLQVDGQFSCRVQFGGLRAEGDILVASFGSVKEILALNVESSAVMLGWF